ncbi:MAG TPA: aldo/keto reductase [Bacteroidota bacterium]|nr:aldo/keto reductase [Bacteroidota bacterium]
MMEQIVLGKTGLSVSRLGVGTWAWGDTSVWGFGKGYGELELRGAYETSIASGVTFFDTAEVYGSGRSEKFLGGFIHDSGTSPVVATKYLPYPWRMGKRAIRSALRRSLERLGLGSVGLYQIHWPFHLLSIPATMSALADAVEEGLTVAVGVSNYSADQVRRAAEALEKRRIALASNQVEYSLLHRTPERNGVRQACVEVGASLIAYSPLAMGMLTGKYSARNLPSGFRGLRYRRLNFTAFERLSGSLSRIGAAHGGKSQSQVALSWVICKGAIPIPGAKSADQAKQNAGALGWSLTEAEIEELDTASGLL